MVTHAEFLPQLLNGIGYGATIALIAIGLSLIFGMLKIVNFAHGALYTYGAYVAFTVFSGIPAGVFSFWLALIAAAGFVGFLGLAMETIFLRPIYKRPDAILYGILLTFGLAEVLRETIQIIWGAMPKNLGIPAYLSGSINLGLFIYPIYHTILIVLAFAVILFTWFFVERTKLGSLIRASAEDPETASSLGVSIHKIYTLTFMLGCVLAGLGGALHTPLVALRAYMGIDILVASFVVVVVGGLGSIPGVLLGGILIGVVRSVTALYWPTAVNVVMFIVLAIMLVIRPTGLMGRIW